VLRMVKGARGLQVGLGELEVRRLFVGWERCIVVAEVVLPTELVME